MTESEIWKDVVGFEGLYKVSNKGNIYSVERKDSRGNKCGGRTLKISAISFVVTNLLPSIFFILLFV